MLLNSKLTAHALNVYFEDWHQNYCVFPWNSEILAEFKYNWHFHVDWGMLPFRSHSTAGRDPRGFPFPERYETGPRTGRLEQSFYLWNRLAPADLHGEGVRSHLKFLHKESLDSVWRCSLWMLHTYLLLHRPKTRPIKVWCLVTRHLMLASLSSVLESEYLNFFKESGF